MNCAEVRSRILAKTHPAKLPQAYKAHVQTCPACEAWHRQLLAVEDLVAAAVVPASERKASFIKQFAAGIEPAPMTAVAEAVGTAEAATSAKAKPAKAKSSAKVAKPKAASTPKPVTPAKPREPLSERLARLWPVGVAAVVVLGGVILWSTKGGDKPNELVAAPADPFFARSVQTKVKLDTATTPAERLKIWLTFAEDIHDEAKTLAKIAPGTEMVSLATMYDQVVTDAMVNLAHSMDIAANKKLLQDCVERLAQAEQAANRLSIEAPNGSSKPLLDIAAAAKTGKERIAKLTAGKA